MSNVMSGEASRCSAHTLDSCVYNKLITVAAQEAAAVSFLANHFPMRAVEFVQSIQCLKGKLVFTGIGKSGVIAKKSAATFSSLGIPSLFLQAHDALHGDLGVLAPGDFLCVFSKSGQGQEFEFICMVAQSRGIKVALICCVLGGLTRLADIVLEVPCQGEACALNLAPTCSTTAMLALSDALAVVASSERGFTKRNFAENHPSGLLGRQLLLTVERVMHGGKDIPSVRVDASFKTVLVEITSKKLGCAVVVDDQGCVRGVITDGDVRRACERGDAVFSLVAHDFMSPHPKTVAPGVLASSALALMESFAITVLVVVDEQKVVGMLHIHDLMQAGIKGE